MHIIIDTSEGHIPDGGQRCAKTGLPDGTVLSWTPSDQPGIIRLQSGEEPPRLVSLPSKFTAGPEEVTLREPSAREKTIAEAFSKSEDDEIDLVPEEEDGKFVVRYSKKNGEELDVIKYESEEEANAFIDFAVGLLELSVA